MISIPTVIVGERVRELLVDERTSGLDIVGCGNSMDRALANTECRTVDTKAILFDSGLSETSSSSFWVLMRLCLPPGVSFIAFSDAPDEQMACKLLAFGVRAIVPFDTPSPKLRQIIKNTLDGSVYLAPTLSTSLRRYFCTLGGRKRMRTPWGMDEAQDLLQSIGKIELLTDRQADVLSLLAIGLSNRQISMKLGISHNTVAFHVTNILKVLGVGSRVEAALLANKFFAGGRR